MANPDLILIPFGILAFLSGLVMLLAKNTLTSALALLSVLLCTAAIYALIGAHFIATIQLVVYAGAIMVLFIFSIMLLNLKIDYREIEFGKSRVIISFVLGPILLAGLYFVLRGEQSINRINGSMTPARLTELGGNMKVLSHALFTQYALSFEVISLALLVAIIAAVVLAKRKV